MSMPVRVRPRAPLIRYFNMNTYIFASLRGNDFTSEGKDVSDAYKNLCDKEKDNGSLWKLSDIHRNKTAVEKQGFKYFKLEYGNSVAYKQV